MENLLRDLKKELERKIKQYENTKTWITDGFSRLTIGKSVNDYYSLQTRLAELATIAAEINVIQDHIGMIEIDLKHEVEQ